MNALMHSHRMRPIATSHGILVDSDAFTLFDSFGGAPTPYKPKPTIDALSYLRPVDTHARVKRATAPFLLHTSLTPSTDTTYKVDNDQDKDQDPDSTFDGSISTIDSIGPYTPPHSRSGTPIIVGSGEQHSCPPFLSLIEPPPEDYVLMDRSNLFTVVPNAGGIHCGTARAIPSHRDREN
jgi:hypothetical protein